MNLKIIVVVSIFCFPLAGFAQAELATQKQKFSYTVGASFAKDIMQRSRDMELDVDAFTNAIRDVLSGSEMRLSEQEMEQVLEVEREKLAQIQQALAEKNKEAGELFLVENAKREGVVQTDSGLQYEIVEEGTGDKPSLDDTVVVHYRGTLINGAEFDSSYKRNTPATFPVNGVIPGWQEGLQLMREGAKWKFFIPSGLAYGERGAGNAIGPHATLIFEVELAEIK